MPADGQGQAVFPKIDDPVGFFLAVLVDVQVDTGCLGVDIPGDFTGGIECLGIGQVVYQLDEVAGHLVRVCSGRLLVPEPAVLIFFYK